MNSPESSAATWQCEFLQEVRKIDREQAPHGLYGMREVLKTGKWLPSLACLLGGEVPETHVAGRLGWKSPVPRREWLLFTTPAAEPVVMEVLTHASTKVRHFGNTYLIDKVHGKKVEEGPEMLEGAVPKLAKAANRVGNKTTASLLFVAHVPSPARFQRLLGKTGDDAFLNRYGLQLHRMTWEDIHGRDFHTGLFLWSSMRTA